MPYVMVPVERAEQLFRKNHKPRTLADLMSIQLEPSTRRIRCVPDEYQTDWTVDKLDWDKVWYIYSSTRAVNVAQHTVLKPKLKTWFDRVRFGLHVKLVQWRVIV